MRWLFFLLLLVHGSIHFMGVVKAFGLAELPQLTQPVSRAMGVAWGAAGVAMLATAALCILAPRLWWATALAALLLSQLVIASSWSDAKFGTLANALILVVAIHAIASQGPLSLRAEYDRDLRERPAEPASPPLVTEADLTGLPEPLQRYLRLTGTVGQPRVRHFSATWRGRIRASPDSPWMSFTAEQHNFPAEPARFFFMDATRTGLPVDVFHAFEHQAATMRVRLLSLVPLVDASGSDLTRAETVTLFNDLCLLAPAALLDAHVRWEPVDARSVRGYYTAGANTVGAMLTFNDAGELVDFVSDDRLAASADGTQFVRRRWSTPIGDYRSFGPRRAAAHGEGRWHPPEGEFIYIELELLDLQTDAVH